MREDIQIAILSICSVTLLLCFLTYHKVKPAHKTCFAEGMISKMADGKAYRVQKSTTENSWEVQPLEK